MNATQHSTDATSVGTKKIKVRVPMDQSGPSWSYAVEADDAASVAYVKPGNVIDMGQGSGSGAEIEFRLQGRAGKRLDFKTSDPVWISVGGCPTGPTPGFPAGVTLRGCTSEKLTLGNDNSGPPAELHYRLNFVDENGNELSWDPVIRNGGGGP